MLFHTSYLVHVLLLSHRRLLVFVFNPLDKLSFVGLKQVEFLLERFVYLFLGFHLGHTLLFFELNLFAHGVEVSLKLLLESVAVVFQLLLCQS